MRFFPFAACFLIVALGGCRKSVEDAYAAFSMANFDSALKDYVTSIDERGLAHRVDMLGAKDLIDEAVQVALKTDQEAAGVQCRLAFCYLCGLGGLVADEAKAIALLQKAGAQNDIQAQNMLLSVLKAKADETAFAKWLAAYAQTGNNQAAKIIYGKALLNGTDGLPKDPKAAVALLEPLDDAEVDLFLAGCYAKGEGVEKDASRAVELWTKVCDGSGHRETRERAQLNLGLCFMNGTGVGKDIDKAQHYLQLAFINSYPGSPKNPTEAVAAAHAGRLYIEGGKDLTYGVSVLAFALQGDLQDAKLKADTLRLAKEWVVKAKQYCVLGETLGADRVAKRWHTGALSSVDDSGHPIEYTKFDVSSNNLVDEWNPPLYVDAKYAPENHPWTYYKDRDGDYVWVEMLLHHTPAKKLFRIDARWSSRARYGQGAFNNEYFQEKCKEVSEYYKAGDPVVTKETWGDHDRVFGRKSTVATWSLKYVRVQLVNGEEGITFSIVRNDLLGRNEPKEDRMGFFPDKQSNKISGFLHQRFGVAVPNPGDYARWGDAGKRSITISNNKMGFAEGQMKIVAKTKKLYEITAILQTTEEGKFRDVCKEIEAGLGVKAVESQEDGRQYSVKGDNGNYEIVVARVSDDKDARKQSVVVVVTLTELKAIAE